MPTMLGTIWAQFVEGTYCYNQSFTFTIHPNNRDITAYSSLTRYNFVIIPDSDSTVIKFGEAGFHGSFPGDTPKISTRPCSALSATM
jgi:hypothetical protein